MQRGEEVTTTTTPDKPRIPSGTNETQSDMRQAQEKLRGEKKVHR